MLPTQPSEGTRESVGSAILCTNIGSFVVLRLLERSTEAFVERATHTTRLALHAGLLGRETTACLCADTVDLAFIACQIIFVSGYLLQYLCFLDIFPGA